MKLGAPQLDEAELRFPCLGLPSPFPTVSESKGASTPSKEVFYLPGERESEREREKLFASQGTQISKAMGRKKDSQEERQGKRQRQKGKGGRGEGEGGKRHILLVQGSDWRRGRKRGEEEKWSNL